MIRPFTVLCLLAACGSGLYLYSEKHRTGLLDRDIGRVIYATEAARARTGLLRAEWALLNEPGRLQDMAGRYLDRRRRQADRVARCAGGQGGCQARAEAVGQRDAASAHAASHRLGRPSGLRRA